MYTLKCAGGCGATAENENPATENSFVWANKNGWGCYSDVSKVTEVPLRCLPVGK